MQPLNPKPETTTPGSDSKPSSSAAASAKASRFPSARAAAKHYLGVLDQHRAKKKKVAVVAPILNR